MINGRSKASQKEFHFRSSYGATLVSLVSRRERFGMRGEGRWRHHRLDRGRARGDLDGRNRSQRQNSPSKKVKKKKRISTRNRPSKEWRFAIRTESAVGVHWIFLLGPNDISLFSSSRSYLSGFSLSPPPAPPRPRVELVGIGDLRFTVSAGRKKQMNGPDG